MVFDWQAAFVFVATLVVLTLVGRFVAFKNPGLRRMRDVNRKADRRKLSDPKFRSAVKRNNAVGLLTNVVFYVTVLPFFVNLEPRPLWRHVFDVFAVLMVYDFFYYLTHRFIFHGKPLLRVHALHHRARTPTYIDALYVHPLETFIGLVLYFGSIPLIAILSGGALNAYSMAFATLVFTQWNTLNHTFVNLPYFPFKTIDYITSIHAAHHVDMKRGNYATLTMVYDWMFGTLEPRVDRSVP